MSRLPTKNYNPRATGSLCHLMLKVLARHALTAPYRLNYSTLNINMLLCYVDLFIFRIMIRLCWVKGFWLHLNSLLLFKSSHHLVICIPDLFISLSLPVIKKEKKAFSRAITLKSWTHFNRWLVIILHVSPNCLDDVVTSSQLWQIALFIVETLQNNFQYGLWISQSIKETHSLYCVYQIKIDWRLIKWRLPLFLRLSSVQTVSANWFYLRKSHLKKKLVKVDKVADENLLHPV